MIDTDVVISTRIRYARNFQDYDFPAIIRGSSHEASIIRACNSVLVHFKGFKTYYMSNLSEVEKLSLTERYIISKNLCDSPNGAVSISQDELLSVMINEEDHIREQCMVKGMDFESALSRINNLDKVLSANCRFANKGGFYYTACPTNLGTGMRASLMMFLPALTKEGRIEGLSRLAASEGITIRGALGEGSFAEGYYYQISNSVTIGDVKKIIEKVRNFALMVCNEEIELRKSQYLENPIKIKDVCLRALGVLTHCAMLSYGEFCEMISQVKLGIAHGIITCSNSSAIDDLAVTARPNTLCLNGKDIAADSEDERRAVFVKNALKTLQTREA